MTSQISLESLNLSWVHRILLCSFCLTWNLLLELIGGGVGIRMSWVENFLKINKLGGDVYQRPESNISYTYSLGFHELTSFLKWLINHNFLYCLAPYPKLLALIPYRHNKLSLRFLSYTELLHDGYNKKDSVFLILISRVNLCWTVKTFAASTCRFL